MTAEIAIINRSAITLAADSAVTLTVRGTRKIYTGTDKIFELSAKDPIGLMIYNNLEFMGVPLDVAIKQFRSSPHCGIFDSLAAAAAAFFDYLMSEWHPSDDLQRQHARQILTPVYRSVRAKFDRSVSQLFQTRRRIDSDRIHQVFLDAIQSEVAEYETLPASGCFEGTAETELIPFYAATLDDLINMVFPSAPMTEPEREQFVRLGALALHRKKFSNILSGLVFSGFGAKEVFPSLIAYHIDGVIAGRLKKETTDTEKTGRDTITAKIIPFAQRDIVDRFLVGIDPELESAVVGYMQSAREATEKNLFSGVSRLSRQSKQKILNNLAQSLGVAVSDFEKTWIRSAKDKYQQQTDDMVLFMAKQELTELAEALVNITSLKRKFSAEEETVAGPIDVAVISKNEGFVWVRRKHYFPSDLNARYFARKFGTLPPGQGGTHATS